MNHIAPATTIEKQSTRTLLFNNRSSYTPQVNKEQELKNRDILRSIGASESQVVALSHRTFYNLPRWARKRFKQIMKLKIHDSRKIQVAKSYFFPHLSPTDLARFESKAPKFRPRWEWKRDDNGNLRRIAVVN